MRVPLTCGIAVLKMPDVLYAACTDDCTITIFDRAADGLLQQRSTQVKVLGGPMWLATDPHNHQHTSLAPTAGLFYCPSTGKGGRHQLIQIGQHGGVRFRQPEHVLVVAGRAGER